MAALAAAVGLLLTVTLAGCVTGGQTTGALPSSGGTSIAFESIDGPPERQFLALVESIAAEAQTRQVAVVSRESNPAYRIRGYLAASVERGRTRIGWVWDVYDGEKRRALRISGEETGKHRGKDPWGAADDALLRKVAQASMERLAAFLGTNAPAAEPEQPDPAIADPRTVAAGPRIEVPLPPQRETAPVGVKSLASLAPR
jgi:hypothetical protein